MNIVYHEYHAWDQHLWLNNLIYKMTNQFIYTGYIIIKSLSKKTFSKLKIKNPGIFYFNSLYTQYGFK